MKEKIEKVVVEQRSYVADDGAEFSTEEACRSYEDALMERKAREIVNDIPHFTYSPYWIDPDFEWNWYLVSSQLDLDAIRTVLYNRDATAHEFEAPSFPCWLAFSVDADGYGCVEGTVEQVLDSLESIGRDIQKMVLKIEGEQS